MMPETQFVTQRWVGDEEQNDGHLSPTVLEVERTDHDEVRIGCDELDGDPAVNVYMTPDRAVEVGLALIYAATRAW